jgi:hypothetical protein
VKSLAELKDEMSEETTGVAKNNGGAELSEAEKLEYAESLKAEQAEKFKQRKAAKAEFALADAEAKVTYLYSRETGCFEPTRNTAAGAKAEGVVAELAQSVGVKLGAPKAEAKAEFAGATIKPKIEAPPRVEPAAFDEKDLTRVPGVVGRLTDWSEAASLYPNRRLALGASLVTFATVIGQRVLVRRTARPMFTLRYSHQLRQASSNLLTMARRRCAQWVQRIGLVLVISGLLSR